MGIPGLFDPELPGIPRGSFHRVLPKEALIEGVDHGERDLSGLLRSLCGLHVGQVVPPHQLLHPEEEGKESKVRARVHSVQPCRLCCHIWHIHITGACAFNTDSYGVS